MTPAHKALYATIAKFPNEMREAILECMDIAREEVRVEVLKRYPVSPVTFLWGMAAGIALMLLVR